MRNLKPGLAILLVLFSISCTGERIWGELEPYTTSASMTFSVTEIFPDISGPVAPNVVMTVRFSAPVDQTSIVPGGNLHLVRKASTDEPVNFAVVLQSDGQSVNLAPATTLQRSSQYEIRVEAGIKANSGSALTNGATRLFSTGSGPLVTTMIPGKDTVVGGDVPNITLNFSESINPDAAVLTVSDPLGGMYTYPFAGNSAVTTDSGHTSFTIDVSGKLPWTPADSGTDRQIKLTINGVTAKLDGSPLDPASSNLYFKIRPWWYPTAATPSFTAASGNRNIAFVSDGSRLWLAMLADNVVKVYTNTGNEFVSLVDVTLGFTGSAIAATVYGGDLFLVVAYKSSDSSPRVSWCRVPSSPPGTTLGVSDPPLWTGAVADSVLAVHAITDDTGPLFSASVRSGTSTYSHRTYKYSGGAFYPGNTIAGVMDAVTAFNDAGMATLLHHYSAVSLSFDGFTGTSSTPSLSGTFSMVSGLAAARWSGVVWAAVGESTKARLFRNDSGTWSEVTATGLPDGFQMSPGTSLTLYTTPDRLFLGYGGGTAGYRVASWRGTSWEVPPHLTSQTVQEIHLAWYGSKLYAAYIAGSQLVVRECSP